MLRLADRCQTLYKNILKEKKNTIIRKLEPYPDNIVPDPGTINLRLCR